MAFDIAALNQWLAAQPEQVEDAQLVKPKQRHTARCDSCKKFVSLFNAVLSGKGVHVHLTEKCLEKFRVKHLDGLVFHKTYRGNGYYD